MSAKKRQDDDEYEFEMPEFDEDEFIASEKRKAKTYFISFGFGIVMAAICHLAWRSIDTGLRWALTFILAVCAIGFLVKLLQMFDIDISEFGKKEWFGSIAFYFFTWLAIFILSVNPPFYDASGPEIDTVALPAIQQPGEMVRISARVTDNVGVEDVAVNISSNGNSGIHPMENNEGVYTYLYHCDEPGTVTYTVVATDENGREQKYFDSFEVADTVMSVEYPSPPLDASDDIEIQVRKNISENKFRVYCTLGGTEVNATLSGEKMENGKAYLLFTTSPEYIGWNQSSVNQVSFKAEVIHYFPGVETACKNIISSSTYNISTTADSSIGDTKSPTVKDLPEPQPLERVPGFELLGALGALAAVLLLFRRRR